MGWLVFDCFCFVIWGALVCFRVLAGGAEAVAEGENPRGEEGNFSEASPGLRGKLR